MMMMVRPNDYGAFLDDDDDDDLPRLNAIGGRYKVGPWRHICGTLIVHSLASEEASTWWSLIWHLWSINLVWRANPIYRPEMALESWRNNCTSRFKGFRLWEVKFEFWFWKL